MWRFLMYLILKGVDVQGVNVVDFEGVGGWR